MKRAMLLACLVLAGCTVQGVFPYTVIEERGVPALDEARQGNAAKIAACVDNPQSWENVGWGPLRYNVIKRSKEEFDISFRASSYFDTWASVVRLEQKTDELVRMRYWEPRHSMLVDTIVTIVRECWERTSASKTT